MEGGREHTLDIGGRVQIPQTRSLHSPSDMIQTMFGLFIGAATAVDMARDGGTEKNTITATAKKRLRLLLLDMILKWEEKGRGGEGEGKKDVCRPGKAKAVLYGKLNGEWKGERAQR